MINGWEEVRQLRDIGRPHALPDSLLAKAKLQFNYLIVQHEKLN